MRKSGRPEDALQKACCELLDIYERQGKLKYFAVPNGGKRSRIEAAIMKGLGVKAGVPDLVIIISRGPTFFIELKSTRGRIALNQWAWIDWIKANGGFRFACTCRTLESVNEVVKWGFTQKWPDL